MVTWPWPLPNTMTFGVVAVLLVVSVRKGRSESRLLQFLNQFRMFVQQFE